jgi:FSR family fosmidomycin resistance protein-like MFS transporter
MSSVIQPAFGYLTDRKSLLWFLPLGSFCAALFLALVGWAPSYSLVLVMVVFSGLGVAIYHPEGWRVANYFAGEKKATGMSIFGVGGNLGFALGPLMATVFITRLGLKGTTLFVIPGAMIAGVFLFSRFWRVDTTAIKKKAPSDPARQALRKALYPMSLLLAMIMFRSWTHIGMLTFIPFFYINYMKGDPMVAANLLFAFLAAGVAGTFIGGPLADKFGHKKIILFAWEPVVRFILFLSAPNLFVWLSCRADLIFLSPSPWLWAVFHAPERVGPAHPGPFFGMEGWGQAGALCRSLGPHDPGIIFPPVLLCSDSLSDEEIVGRVSDFRASVVCRK